MRHNNMKEVSKRVTTAILAATIVLGTIGTTTTVRADEAVNEEAITSEMAVSELAGSEETTLPEADTAEADEETEAVAADEEAEEKAADVQAEQEETSEAAEAEEEKLTSGAAGQDTEAEESEAKESEAEDTEAEESEAEDTEAEESEAEDTEAEESEVEDTEEEVDPMDEIYRQMEANNQQAMEAENAEDDSSDTFQPVSFAEMFDDAVVVTEEDKKAASADITRAKEEALKKEKEEREEREKLINSTGGDLTEMLISQLSNTDGKATDEIIADIASGTFKVLNKDLVKSIPYIGGILSALGDAALSDGTEPLDPTAQALTSISDQLEALNETMQKCTQEVTSRQDMQMNSQVINDINASYKNVNMFYMANSSYFVDAVNILSTTDEDAAERECVTSIFENIYSAVDEVTAVNENRVTFLSAYNAFLDQITNSGSICSNYSACQGNIFEVYDKVCSEGKDGTYCLMESEEGRRAMTTTVQENIQYGYDVLHTAITLDMEKQQILMLSYDNALTSLKETLSGLEEGTDEYTSTLDSIRSLTKARFRCQTTCNADACALNNLVQKKAVADVFIQNRETALDTEEAAYESAKATLTQSCVTYEKLYNFYTETINGKTAYPSFNAKDNTIIEYRDQYGNLLATRKINGYKEISKNDVQVGKIYRFQAGTLDSLVEDITCVTMQVISIDKGKWYQPRTAYGYAGDGAYYNLSYGPIGIYNVYELSIGDLTIVA